MITFETERDFEISQASYEACLKRLPFQQMRCPCGNTGALVRYGSSVRRVKIGGREAPLTISRLKCKVCNRTHAVLPSFIVPYSRVTVWEQVEILRGLQSGQGCSAVMERNFSIDESLSSSIVRRFHILWENRLLSQGIPLVCSEELIRMCFHFFGIQFMQMRGANIFVNQHSFT